MTNQAPSFDPTTGPADPVTISLLCADESLAAFCRRLAAAVNPGPMYLARAFAVATQVYPVRLDAVWGEVTVLNCEFRMRRAGAPVDVGAVADLRRRLLAFDVLEHHFVPPMAQVEAASLSLAAS